MFAINKYKRKPVTDVLIKVYLNGRVFTEAAGHSAEAMGDKEIVQKVLSLALVGNIYAYKCKICNTIEYMNTTRSVNTWCRKCNKSSVIRSVKDDTRKEAEK